MHVKKTKFEEDKKDEKIKDNKGTKREKTVFSRNITWSALGKPNIEVKEAITYFAHEPRLMFCRIATLRFCF